MKQMLKHYIKTTFPHAVSAYHEYRNRQQYKGFTPRKSPHGFDFIGTPAMQDGSFEPEETAVIQTELTRCDAFVDIGANVGYFACLARSLEKKVIAIEPMTDNLSYLYANLNINDWHDVEVFPLGLAGKPCTADLYGGGTGASLVSRWAGCSDIWKRTIALSTLDIIIGTRFHGQRLLIKIDVEGFEYEVLKGACATLAMAPKPVWLLEICFTEHHPDGVNPHFRSVFEFFWNNNYTAVSIEGNGREVTPADVDRWLASGHRDFGYVSYLFREKI